MRRLRTLWRNLTRRNRLDADLDDELRSYREMLEDQKACGGADSATAHREAMIEFGGTQQVTEAVRDVRAGHTLQSFGAELRQSLRALRRNPGLTLIATSMLALGIGAGTVVFSIFYAALVQPLPFRDSVRVVQLWETRHGANFDRTSFTEANFWDVRTMSHSFEELALYVSAEGNLTGDGPPEKVSPAAVSAGFFRTLGVAPILGRDFTYDEERSGSDHVMILGNRFWKTHFGGDPNILGRTVHLNEKAFKVIGVLPPGEPWIDDQFYFPYGYRADADRSSWEFDVVGRLKKGVSMNAARADLQRVAGILAQSYPKEDKGIGIAVTPSSDWVAPDTTRRALWVLLGAVAFLLLIACVNIANLLLARGMSRQREIAVRTALGAGRARLVRFVMLESVLLSVFGALFGLLLAYGGLRALQAMQITAIPRLADAGLNGWVLGFTALIAIVTGVLSGLAPALRAPTGAIATTLRDGDHQTGTRRHNRLRSILVIAEVALSFLLLVGAGLLIRSFTQLTSVNLGFQIEKRLVLTLAIPGSYFEKHIGKQFLDRFFERVSAVPGVLAAGAISHRPVEGGNPGMNIDTAGGPQATNRKAPLWAQWRVVTPGYFPAAGLPLLRGRVFNDGDKPVWVEPGQPVPPRRVMISARLAKRLFANQDAVGRHVTLWAGQAGLVAEVIGVAGDSRERGLSANLALTVYLPFGVNALPGEVVVHTSGDPMALVPTIRSIVAGLDPNLPVADVRTFAEVVSRSVAPERFNAILLAVFGGLALLLATTGIYGVLSYSMSRRTAEIGLRVALGASRRNILAMTIGQGMRPVLLGIVAGVVGAAWLSRYVASLLFGVKPFDAITYGIAAAILLVTALAACIVPGRRAMTTDPVIALRAE